MTHYHRQLKFKKTAPLRFHAMTGSFFIVLVFHFIQFEGGWGLLFWIGFGLLGNFILAKVWIIRLFTYGDSKRFYLLGNDGFEIIMLWCFKGMNYMSYFFDILLYWNEGSIVGHIFLDIVLFYDLADFAITMMIYSILNYKYFKALLIT